MANDITRTRLTNYTVVWDSYDFGFTDANKIAVPLKLKELKVGSIGDVVLGHRIIGVEPEVEIEAREFDLTFIRKMMPWYTSGSISLNPATVHKDLYDYAKLLTLHPIDMGATLTQDLNFLKALPIFKPLDADGEDDNVSVTKFMFYPDRASLPTLIYGYLGVAP